MSDSSKSTRNFSTRGVILAIFLVVLVSGYSSYQLATSRSFTTLNEKSIVSSKSSSFLNSTSTTQTNSTTSNLENQTSISFSTTNTSAATITNKTMTSGPTLYTISKSYLQNWLNLSSAKMVPSSTKVPYYIVSNSTGSTLGLIYLTTDVAPESCWGYNGPIGTLVLVNTTGYLKALTIYSIMDSWGYMITQTWLNTYVGRSVFEPLRFGVDAQPVTGATYSSEGVIDGVRDAGRIVIDDFQQQKANSVATSLGSTFILGAALNLFSSLSREPGLQSELTIIALACLFVAAVIAFELKSTKIRYGVYIGSILFMGFYMVRMVTVGDFGDFLRWIFPPFARDPYWYFLYAGVLVTSLIWGRFYCGYLCPFGSFTDILNRISPIKLKVPYKYQSKLRNTKYIVLSIVILELLEGTFLYQVEPFGTLFEFSGDTLAWMFLGLMVGSSIFVDRFYCTYVCPAGAGLSLLSWFRLREIKRWPECKRCMICANHCTRQAISGDRISTLECMDCRDCEKLYLNRNICPHYAQERVLTKKKLFKIATPK